MFRFDQWLRRLDGWTTRAKKRKAQAETTSGKRRLSLESLEERLTPAFTSGDVFASSNTSPNVYNVTAGGNFSGATPFATLPGTTTYGQFAWTSDLSTAYVTQYPGGTITALSSTGVATSFASGLSGPTGLILTADGRLLASEYTSGEVTNVSAGGNFTSATPFAIGLSGPRNFLQLPNGKIYVTEYNSGEVTEITAGGNFTGATPFASGLSSPSDLVRTADGKIYVSSPGNQRVY